MDKAKTLSDKSLANDRWDTDAFIVSALVELLQRKDLVPESNIDEQMTDITFLFESYYKHRSIETLNTLLSSIRKMLSELYHIVDSEDERELFKIYLGNLQSIYTKTII